MTIGGAVLFTTAVLPVTAFATTISLDPVDANLRYTGPVPVNAPIPDILSISAGFDATTLFLAASFLPGTLDPDPNNLAFLFALDTDLNASTGNSFFDPATGRQLGLDYYVLYHIGKDPPAIASVLRPVQNGNPTIPTVPVVFGVDNFTIAVPLSFIGGNGVTNFGLVVGIPIDPRDLFNVTIANTDFAIAADSSTPISASVPEPGNFMLLSTGVLSLLVYKMSWNRRRG